MLLTKRSLIILTCVLLLLQQFKILNCKMFQPHSVRGLLSRRNISRLDAEQQLNNTSAGDNDLQSMIQTKLIIKDVQHQIDDIRQWRDNQKIIFQDRLASNQAIAKVTVDEYLSYLDRQTKRQQEDTSKLLKKLQIKDNDMQSLSESNNWNNSDTNIFDFVTSSNKLVEEIKYEQQNQAEAIADNHQAFLNQLQNMGGILHKKQNQRERQEEKKQINREMLKKQLQEIDDQLKEIQDLLKD